MPEAPVNGAQSGITAGRDVSQSAGRDAAGRDLTRITIGSVVNILSGSGVLERYWSGPGAEEAVQALGRTRLKVQREYRERLRQVFGDALAGLRLELHSAPDLLVDRLAFLPGAPIADKAPVNPVLSRLLEQADRVLLLGGPGSGKTTLLLQLALDLLSEDRGSDARVPLILPLASWKAAGRAIRRGRPTEQFEAWLAVTIQELYQIPPEVTRVWVRGDRLVLLLDGLDEVGGFDARADCLDAVNAFVSAQSAVVVLTSRVDEYTALPSRARFERAVVVQPLDPAAVLAFVEASTHGPLAALAQRLRQDGELLALCLSPLLLAIVMHSYPWPEHADGQPRSRTDQILDTYVARRLSDDRPWQDGKDRWSPEAHRRWLSVLAHGTAQRGRRVFLLEHVAQAVQPPRWWMVDRLPLLCLVLLVVLLIARDGGAVVNAGQAFGALLLLAVAQSSPADRPESAALHPRLLRAIPWYAMALAGLLGAVAGGLYMHVNGPGLTTIRTVPGGPSADPVVVGAGYGSLLVCCLVVTLWCVSPREIQPKREPFDSFKESVLTAAVAFSVAALTVLAVAVAIPLLTGMQDSIAVQQYLVFQEALPPLLNQGLRIAVLGGLAFTLAFSSSLTHVVVYPWQRLLLHLSGRGPLRYLRWLDEMVDRRILYRSGPGFVFMHERLQTYLAQQEGEHQDLARRSPVLLRRGGRSTRA